MSTQAQAPPYEPGSHSVRADHTANAAFSALLACHSCATRIGNQGTTAVTMRSTDRQAARTTLSARSDSQADSGRPPRYGIVQADTASRTEPGRLRRSLTRQPRPWDWQLRGGENRAYAVPAAGSGCARYVPERTDDHGDSWALSDHEPGPGAGRRHRRSEVVEYEELPSW